MLCSISIFIADIPGPTFFILRAQYHFNCFTSILIIIGDAYHCIRVSIPNASGMLTIDGFLILLISSNFSINLFIAINTGDYAATSMMPTAVGVPIIYFSPYEGSAVINHFNFINTVLTAPLLFTTYTLEVTITTISITKFFIELINCPIY